MPTPSAHLGLAVPNTSDPFSTADLADNWDRLDDFPGTYICDSTSHPAWGAAQQGMRILERNTGLEWRWDGAAFQRIAPIGLLKTTTGGWARGQRTADFQTSSATYVIVVPITGVVVPAGRRTLRIDVTFFRAEAGGTAANYFYGAVFRSSTNNTGTQEFTFACPDNSSGTHTGYVPGGLAAGTYDWSFQIMKFGAATSPLVRASATTPCEISIIEI